MSDTKTLNFLGYVNGILRDQYKNFIDQNIEGAH